MKTSSCLILIFLMTFLNISNSYAVRAYPFPISITQPDGTTLTVCLHGDEFHNYRTTIDNYTLLPDNAGILTYAQIDSNGNLVSSTIRATNVENRSVTEKTFLAKINTNLGNNILSRMSRANRVSILSSNSKPQKAYPLNGNPKSIVILVNFKDVSFVTSNPQAAFTNLLNQKGYSANNGTGSAKDYFRDNSSGVFNPQFDVVGPFNLPQNMAYYGANEPNNASGDDVKPEYMIADACTAAAAAGVNFAQYDTDNDGIVDNVFVYYAGHNEAEGGSLNSIWPHRWSLSDAGYSGNRTFNGKLIDGYACTSELRLNAGSTMCGVGTFCHEFGHVLGLEDLYVTDNTIPDHFTLSSWDIMDSGNYLNSGKTPCGYSSYERFFLNWLVPSELKVAQNLTLDTLSTSNRAYLISQYGNHNLNGENPIPVEFFMLENRQKSGWDTYLPGHGMLVTHIYYDATTWSLNKVNNNPTTMGIDLVEADNIPSESTLSGDPFPATSNVTYWIPSLRTGTNIQKPLTNIKEINGKIFFKFMGGSLKITPPIATSATDLSYYKFIANWDKDDYATGYYLTVYNLSDGVTNINQGFNNGLVAPKDWMMYVKNSVSYSNYYGKNPPAIEFSNSDEYIETERYILPVIKLSFYIHSLAASSGGFLIEAENDQNSWEKVDSIPVTTTLFENAKTYTFAESKDYTRFRFTYTKGAGSLTFDDVSVNFNKKLSYIERDKWITATSDTVENLIPNNTYVFRVKSSDKDTIFNYENITDFSNEISSTTLGYPILKKLIATTDANGNVKAFLSEPDGNLIVYNLLGQIIKIIIPTTNPVIITDLPRNQLYILKSNTRIAKIAI